MNLPRIGFVGLGWIGQHRMQAMMAAGVADVAAVCDASPEAEQAALDLAPGAIRAGSLEEMLDLSLDGVVIATPSGLHASQSKLALRAGLAVFCQKPLGRTAAEVETVVEAARRADRLLAVDLSYRFTMAMQRIRAVVASGGIGRCHAVDLVFHNAYGPDKAWYRDVSRSGGGCVMDLGVHLVDLALWTLGFPRAVNVDSDLFAGGVPLDARRDRVEDYAAATVRLEGGAIIRLTCSWNLHAGWDAVISAAFHGTEGGAAMRNLGGSFYDFTAERFTGTVRETLAVPPDEWGGRAAVDWARRLGAGDRFDPEGGKLVQVAGVLDRIYGRPQSVAS